MNNKINTSKQGLINPLNNENLPVIFCKKINNDSKVIPVNDTINTLGFTRHYPAAIKEWLNSVYVYNKNSIKSLPMADKTISSLITSYFNMYFNKKMLQSKRVPMRFRRMSLNKIFLGKAELKHTSDKIIVTLYVFNEEKRILIKKIKRLEAVLFPSIKASNLFKKRKNLTVSFKEMFGYLTDEKLFLFRQIQKAKLFFLNKIDKGELLTKEEYLVNKLINLNDLDFNDTFSLNKIDDLLNMYFVKTELEEEIKTLAKYKLLLNLNRSKFEDTFLKRLSILISLIYNKEVQFNIINLKTLHFDSNIFTQVIAAKLKNRNNKLLRVLKSSLFLVKLPNTNKIQEKYGKNKNDFSWINRVKNLKVNSMLINDNSFNMIIDKNKDMLSQLFTDVFSTPQKTVISSNVVENTNSTNIDSIENIVLNSLKYKKMAGVRLEAKGRLTKRFTASRSVFKVKWKGSLKNIDSTYKGLSSVILRGHVKSNVQYSVVNSKTRNGSFGLKGWISSK